jgi:thiamine-phosphate pyrophosphorylase
LLLCYITDCSQLPGDEEGRRRHLLKKIAEAAQCGVDYIQLREKDLSARELESLAGQALKAIRSAAPSFGKRERTSRLLLNSRTDVAIAAGADGVHLRSDDISPSEARAIWKAGVSTRGIISVSCHTSSEVARAATEEADLAVFAPVFEKRDSPGAVTAGLEELRRSCGSTIPVLALGGITLENAHSCVEAGAAGIAAIRLFQENSIAEVVRALRNH